MNRDLSYDELLKENLELRQSIEELRKYYKELSKFALTIKESKPALTDKEIEAIKWCVEQWTGIKRAETLRNLLERIKDK
jgi:hypothetical protein